MPANPSRINKLKGGQTLRNCQFFFQPFGVRLDRNRGFRTPWPLWKVGNQALKSARFKMVYSFFKKRDAFARCLDVLNVPESVFQHCFLFCNSDKLGQAAWVFIIFPRSLLWFRFIPCHLSLHNDRYFPTASDYCISWSKLACVTSKNASTQHEQASSRLNFPRKLNKGKKLLAL